ncbi:MAG: hypothetical protein ACMUIP_04525 [bacterium]
MKEIKYLLANYIDEFNSANKKKKMEMVKHFPFSQITDKKQASYTAATVEELCYRNKLPIPDWVFARQYYLQEPYFVGGLETLKAFLIAESPLSFRRRNIFVSENVLERA